MNELQVKTNGWNAGTDHSEGIGMDMDESQGNTMLRNDENIISEAGGRFCSFLNPKEAVRTVPTASE